MSPILSQHSARRVALSAGWLSAVLGVCVLAGWAFDVAFLKSPLPGPVNMKANTAAETLLGGTALALLALRNAGTTARLCATAIAGTAAVLGLLTLCESVFGWDIGIDQLLFSDAGALNPGRMAPSAAFCFALAGGSLLAASRPIATRLKLPIVEAPGVTVSVVGGFGLATYALDAVFHFGWSSYTGVAVNTALGIGLLGCGLLALARSLGGLQWSLSRAATWGFVAGIGSLLAVAGISHYFVSQLRQSAAGISRSEKDLRKIEEVTTDVANLGSSQRSYINTGNEPLLKQEEEMNARLRSDLDDLRRLTVDNPKQQDRLRRLQPLIARRIAWGEQTVATRRKEGLAAAERMIATGEGIALSDRVRRVIKEMEDNEYALLKERQGQEEATSLTTFLLLPLGVFLSIAVLCQGLFFLNSGVREKQGAEEQLKASYKEITDLKAALDEHAIVAITDPQGTMTYVNDKFCVISQYTRQELLGQDHRLVNSGYHPKEYFRSLWTAVSQGKVWRGEIRNRAKDGSAFWVDTTIVPFLDENGRPRQYVSIHNDITERKRSEAAVAQLAAIVESSDDAIIGKNLEGVVTSWNAGAERIFGYTAAEMVGQPMERLIPPERQQEEAETLSRILRGESVRHFDTERVCKDGSVVPTSVTVSPVRDSSGRIVGASKVARDITERKRAEEALREANEGLERKVAERTGELQLAKERAEAADRAKSQFLASMSHELRTPLNGIIGFSEFLMDGKPGALNPKQREYLGDILNSGRHLSQLINDVLDLAKVEAGKIELIPDVFTLRKAIEEVCAVGVPIAHKKHLRVSISVAPALADVMLDQMRFKQVVYNLLSNALKFTDPGGRVDIRCQTNGDEQFTLAVEDTGIGIKPEDMGRLFKEFEQIESGAARRYEGTGLGLALTRKLVEMQGGSISAASVLGKGSTFTVHLPLVFPKERR